MPATARQRRTVLRTVLLPLFSLLLLAGLALLGPAAVAAPSAQTAAAHQGEHSSSRNGPATKKRRHHGHKKRGHKPGHHQPRHHQPRHHQPRHHQPAPPQTTPPQGTDIERRVELAASIVLQHLGDPYRWGAAGPHAFDCSGLMQYSFGKAGIDIPRTAAAQSGRAHHIARSKLRRGDLLYFFSGGRVFHTAMFLKWDHGAVQMVDAPGTGKSVRIERPWTNSWFAGTMR